ncbi:anthrone oxygenase family protein [Candidatus Binatus sp.]|uniref:anthrone oxygenase family protein n=1 Tax=Candidatus Binatus sp. TaxID=2811406 RepID=UPI003BB0BBCE
MTLHLLSVLALGLMCGSELNVAAFAHPMLNRQPLGVHVRMRASLAALFGRVMPFWMAGSTLLNLLLLLPLEHLNDSAWRFAAVAFTIQVFAVVLSLVGPVPINNRIAKWTPDSLAEDWQVQEHRWDQYHWIRTAGLIVAFAVLVLSVRAR